MLAVTPAKWRRTGERVDLAGRQTEIFREYLAVVLTETRRRDVFWCRGIVEHQRAAVNQNVAVLRMLDFAQHTSGVEMIVLRHLQQVANRGARHPVGAANLGYLVARKL